ncbi:non-selective voltage-gated ion channel VDAC1-like [Arvicanthis niloticus]|uniref:non-selective voltage-gated ion channel VDAC1-like n=1 Tax=Arvicanthis niloticus TaxID=61156 RepID=UPI00402BC328
MSFRDVFTKGFGLVKLHLKTKSENGLKFSSSGFASLETTKVNRSPETKYRWTEYGLRFEKWSTDNPLGTEITVEDQLAHGLKLTFDSSFLPNTGVNDGTEFGGSVYQKVNQKLQTAVNLAWTAGNSNTCFINSSKYQVDPAACFSGKVKNSSLIDLGYTQTLPKTRYQTDAVSPAG